MFVNPFGGDPVEDFLTYIIVHDENEDELDEDIDRDLDLDEDESGHVSCVLVKDLSRFGRDYIEAGRYLERWLPDHNARFIAINDGIDSIIFLILSISLPLASSSSMGDLYAAFYHI